ncbi:MAG: LuxR C-terminal-related transcriptional regulator [Meiothermus sp.]|nr:LuxR C-terminal-related transcriptional regulator [Meiothermus sp.]
MRTNGKRCACWPWGTLKQNTKNLGLSEGIVKNYVSVILEKLQVKNRTQVANAARDLQLF